jgi:hypothetical protein
MEFRPTTTTPGRSAIELWNGPDHVATIYAQREGLHIVCAAGYVPADLALDVHASAGVAFTLRREE